MTQKTPQRKWLHDSDQRCEPVSLRLRKTILFWTFGPKSFRLNSRSLWRLKFCQNCFNFNILFFCWRTPEPALIWTTSNKWRKPLDKCGENHWRWSPFYGDVNSQFSSSLFSPNAFLFSFVTGICSFWSFLHFESLPNSTPQLLLQEIGVKYRE